MLPSLCLIGDVPPPYSGPEIGMQKLLRSGLRKRFHIHHFSFRMNTANRDRGSVTARKVFHFLVQLYRLRSLLNRRQPGCVYYYFAQTRLGLFKDLLVTSVIQKNSRKILLHLRGSNFPGFYRTQPGFVRRLIRTNLGRGDRILVQSECLKGMFDGVVAKEKIGVLYNGLEWNELSEGKATTKKGDELIVFFLGQLSFAKGYFDLILALPEIVSQIPNVRFLFAGERIPLEAERNIHLDYICGKDTPSEIVKRAGGIESTYADHIEFLGVIDANTRADIMARTDLFVLPTYSEGFSNAVLEAMGYGLPVVTTPVGAHPDIFAETPEVLVPPGDPKALAERVITLLKDESIRKHYGAHNRKQIVTRYNMDKVAEQFAQAVESVM